MSPPPEGRAVAVDKLLRRTLVGVVLGVLLYAGWILYSGYEPVSQALSGYAWSAVALALALSSANYLIRFIKWELCLHWLDVRNPQSGAPELTRTRSLLIYLAGLSMSVTPGKVGEVLRSWLLRSTDGVAFARTAPVVLVDRLTDFVALVLLSLVGVTEYRDYLPVIIASIVVVLLGVGILGSPRLCHGLLNLLQRLPGIGGLAGKARGLVDSSAELMTAKVLVVLSLLSVVGWGLECVGYYVVLHGFFGVEASLSVCTFLWAVTTLIGALSFLPGGLGATEGSLALLIAELAVGVSPEIALASTMLIRACTLWYGEVVGGIALGFVIRHPRFRADRGQIAPA